MEIFGADNKELIIVADLLFDVRITKLSQNPYTARLNVYIKMGGQPAAPESMWNMLLQR